MERDKLKAVILDHFLPFHPPKMQKNLNFEKMKKNGQRYHFTRLLKILIIRCTVAEIQSEFCHFGPFFAFNPPITTQKIKILKKLKKQLQISF